MVREIDFNKVLDEVWKGSGPMTQRGEERSSLKRKLYILSITFLAEFHNGRGQIVDIAMKTPRSTVSECGSRSHEIFSKEKPAESNRRLQQKYGTPK
jgi:hypothetical protein